MKAPAAPIEPRAGVAYRPDIDGLRGIAVIAVVLYHAYPSWLPGGFVGVDVFFVVSGFLITGIVLDDLENGHFKLAHFYARRIRRLFPALIVVLLACFGMAAIYLLENEFRQFGRHVAGASAFVSNFVLWAESGYFDTAARVKPLLHLWSLGIEEQFYLAWPLILLLTWRRRGMMLAAILAIAVVSLAVEVQRTPVDSADAFFSPVTRFWELLCGVFLAAWGRGARREVPRVLALAGLGAIVITFFMIDSATPFPGWWAVAPVMGTACVIAAGPATPIHRRLLAAPVLVWVGLISYPLYLWHWPLLSFAHIFGSDDALTRGILATASVGLAWLTWRFVERPMRFGRTFPRVRIAALAAAMAAIGALGLLVGNGAVSSWGSSRLRAYDADRAWTYDKTARLKPMPLEGIEFDGAAKLKDDLAKYSNVMSFRSIPSGSPRRTLFLGDSQMEQYWPRVDQVISENPGRSRTAVFLTASAFLPVPIVHSDAVRNPQYVGLARAMVSYALSDPGIENVVFAAIWTVHFAEWGAGESSYYVWVDGKPQYLKRGRRANDLAYESLGESIRLLRSAGKRVFILQEDFVGEAKVVRSWKGFTLDAPPASASLMLARFGPARERLARLARETGAEILDPMPTLCPDGKSCPLVYDGEHPVYMDGRHFADRYARHHARYLDTTLLLDR